VCRVIGVTLRLQSAIQKLLYRKSTRTCCHHHCIHFILHVCAVFTMLANQSGRTKLAGGVIEEPYGRYCIEPTSPVSVESIRMITLRIKLDINIVQGESMIAASDKLSTYSLNITVLPVVLSEEYLRN